MFDRKQLRNSLLKKESVLTEEIETSLIVKEERIRSPKWYNRDVINKIVTCSRCNLSAGTFIKVSKDRYSHKECMNKNN